MSKGRASTGPVTRPGRFVYPWPRPSVTADVALFRLSSLVAPARLEVLLIRRGRPPFAGAWALPGGFVDRDEDLPVAAARELEEETGVRKPRIEQVGVIGTPGRDPRGHTVTALYVAATDRARAAATAGDDASEVGWFPPDELPALAFDHGELVAWAVAHLRDRVGRTPVFFDLLPRRFRGAELTAAWSAVTGSKRGLAGELRRWVTSGALVADGDRHHLDRRALARLDPLALRAGR